MKNIGDYILILKEFVPENVCEGILNEYNQNIGNFEDQDLKNGLNVYCQKEFSRFSYTFDTIFQSATFHYIENIFPECFKSSKIYKKPSDFECPLLFKNSYTGFGGEYNIDCFDSLTSRRSISYIVNLGGDNKTTKINFNLLNKDVGVELEEGSIACFPSNWMFPYKIINEDKNDNYFLISRSLINETISSVNFNFKF